LAVGLLPRETGESMRHVLIALVVLAGMLAVAANARQGF
jgi:hypothetical protein